MPKIPEYTSSAKLNANNAGHSAYDALGRRVGAAYNSIAQSRRDFSYDMPYGALAGVRARSGALTARQIEQQGEYDALLERLRNPQAAQLQGGGGTTGFNARSSKKDPQERAAASKEVGDAAAAVADAMSGKNYGGGGDEADKKFNPLRYSSPDYGGYVDPNFVPDPNVKGVDKDGNPVTEQPPWRDIRQPVPKAIAPGVDYSGEEPNLFDRFWSNTKDTVSSVAEAAVWGVDSVGSAISNIFATTPGASAPLPAAYAPIPPAE